MCIQKLTKEVLFYFNIKLRTFLSNLRSYHYKNKPVTPLLRCKDSRFVQNIITAWFSTKIDRGILIGTMQKSIFFACYNDKCKQFLMRLTYCERYFLLWNSKFQAISYQRLLYFHYRTIPFVVLTVVLEYKFSVLVFCYVVILIRKL